MQHGGTSSADEYTHQGALNEKLHRERPVCPPHPSRHSSGCQEQRERERERERERKREREQSRVGLHSKRVHRPKRDSNSPIGSRASRGRRPRNDVKCRCTIESPRLLEIAGHWRAYLDRVCLGLR